MTEPTPPITEFYAPVMRDRSHSAQKLLLGLLAGKIENSAAKLVAVIEAQTGSEQPEGEATS